jgi:hypothetical protein
MREIYYYYGVEEVIVCVVKERLVKSINCSGGRKVIYRSFIYNKLIGDAYTAPPHKVSRTDGAKREPPKRCTERKARVHTVRFQPDARGVPRFQLIQRGIDRTDRTDRWAQLPGQPATAGRFCSFI